MQTTLEQEERLTYLLDKADQTDLTNDELHEKIELTALDPYTG